MKENKQLTVPVLDALSNLILKPELLAEVCRLDYVVLCYEAYKIMLNLNTHILFVTQVNVPVRIISPQHIF